MKNVSSFFRGNSSIEAAVMGEPNECTCKNPVDSYLSYEIFHRRRVLHGSLLAGALLEENWEKLIDRIPVERHESHIGQEHLVVWEKL